MLKLKRNLPGSFLVLVVSLPRCKGVGMWYCVVWEPVFIVTVGHVTVAMVLVTVGMVLEEIPGGRAVLVSLLGLVTAGVVCMGDVAGIVSVKESIEMFEDKMFQPWQTWSSLRAPRQNGKIVRAKTNTVSNTQNTQNKK